MTAVKELAEKFMRPEAKAATVVKVIEVIGTSKVSFDDAIAGAVRTASHSLRHVTGADVKHMTIGVTDGAVTEYRVDLKLAFALEPDDDKDDD